MEVSNDDRPASVYRLRTIIRGREMVFDLSTGVFYMGNSRQADVKLPVVGVSRRHALITTTPTSFVVEDLGSKNGTWVNGARASRQAVPLGAELRLGPVRLRLDAVTAEEIELGIDLDPGSEPDTPFSMTESDESTLVVRGDRPTVPTQRLPWHELNFPSGYCVGTSAPMTELYAQMNHLRRGSLPVLVTGETGVGKELIARILHDSSDRRRGPFVAINCAALPAELLEAEMFGIGKGVATGVEPRKGKFELADGGTLLLDEVGEMPLAAQAKLLRALQEKEVQPLGESPRKVDVRVISATNVDLLQQAGQGGSLRPDLFYRLAGGLLEIPPLRRRSTSDLHSLIEFFLRRFRNEAGIKVRGLSVAALNTLCSHPWPGNVRELEHEIRRLVYSCRDGEVIVSDRLAGRLRRPGGRVDATDRWLAERESLELAPAFETIERALIREALHRARGKKVEACRLLGLSRNGLDKKLKRLDISVDASKSDTPSTD